MAEHTVFVVSVRNGSQLTGVPWDLCLAGHTSATHTHAIKPNRLLNCRAALQAATHYGDFRRGDEKRVENATINRRARRGLSPLSFVYARFPP